MNLLNLIRTRQNLELYRALNWEGSYGDYLEMVVRDPAPLRTSYQRVYDMIMSYGSDEYSQFRQKLVHYRFFDDPLENGRDGVFGLDRSITARDARPLCRQE